MAHRKVFDMQKQRSVEVVRWMHQRLSKWLLRCQWNDMKKSRRSWLNESMNCWRNEAIKQWFRRWISQSMKQRTGESMKQRSNESVDERSSESIPVWIPPMWPGPAILKAQFLFQTSASINWLESFGKWPHVATTKPQCAATLPKESAGQLRSDDSHRWQPSPP